MVAELHSALAALALFGHVAAQQDSYSYSYDPKACGTTLVPKFDLAYISTGLMRETTPQVSTEGPVRPKSTTEAYYNGLDEIFDQEGGFFTIGSTWDVDGFPETPTYYTCMIKSVLLDAADVHLFHTALCSGSAPGLPITGELQLHLSTKSCYVRGYDSYLRSSEAADGSNFEIIGKHKEGHVKSPT